MSRDAAEVLRDQGRGIVGALVVVGVPMLYTMEMWWHGWQLSTWALAVYAAVGLAIVLVVTRSVGFREEDQETKRLGVRHVVIDFAELLLQSFATAYLVLGLFGVIEPGDSLVSVVRLGLIFVAPLGFGAALTNQLLRGAEEGRERTEFPNYLATFALGAAFFVAPIAPTDEMELLVAHAGWVRLSLIVPATLLVSYLLLFELELRGQHQRVEGRTLAVQLGHLFVAYAIGAGVSAGLLAGYGHFDAVSVEVWIQEVVVLAFGATVGASAARVVLA